MAKKALQAAAGNGGQKRGSSQRRDYVVVVVENGTAVEGLGATPTSLRVVDTYTARKPEEAMDIAFADMVAKQPPPPEHTKAQDTAEVTLGAFVASSYREQDFTSKREWQTKKSPRKPAFL